MLVLRSNPESNEILLKSKLSDIRVNCTNEFPPPTPELLEPPAAVASKLLKRSPSPAKASKKSLTSELESASAFFSGVALKLAIASSILSSKNVVSLKSRPSFANKSCVILTF